MKNLYLRYPSSNCESKSQDSKKKHSKQGPFITFGFIADTKAKINSI